MDINFTFDSKKADDHFTAALVVSNPEFNGKHAIFTIEHEVEVKDSSPVHDSRELFKHVFKVKSNRQETVRIPRRILDKSFFTYEGEKIEVRCFGKLSVNDKLIFEDTSVQKDLPSPPLEKPAVDSDVDELIEPKDVFSMIKNFNAIPAANKLAFIGLLLVALPIMGLNMVVGIHDQSSPESQTWLYSHRDSDGDAQSPFLNALFGSGAIGVAIWLCMRRQLGKYMNFRFKSIPGPINRQTEHLVSDLVSGTSRANLKNVTLRIVACNLEMGQYRRGSGSNRRTVSFSHPVRGVLLYSKKVKLIPKKEPVENYFEDSMSFEPMFKALYPANEVSGSHGLSIYWELQLLQDDFVDQELVGNTGLFRRKDFYSS
tara:strand:- start:2932 stop:4047 length:1116 start_codon:yes stop_codon:yes gene_type:complete